MTFEQLEDKDPDSLNKDYLIDFAPLRNGQTGAVSDYLQAGETISSIVSVTTSDALLTIVSSALEDSNSSVRVITSGGTRGRYARITVRITTDSTPARTDDRTFQIYITDL